MIGVGINRVVALHFQINRLVNEAQRFIPQKRPGQKPRFAKNLKAVADANDHSAPHRKVGDFAHNGGKTGNGSRAQIIAVRETARQDNHIAIIQIMVLVPEIDHRLFQDILYNVITIIVTVGTGKSNHAKLHFPFSSSMRKSSMTGLDKSLRAISRNFSSASLELAAATSTSKTLPERTEATCL